MKRTVLLGALVLLALPAHAATPTLSFATPAQFQGGLNATGLQWAFFVFHGPDAASFHLQAEGDGTATNHTTTVWSRQWPPPVGGPPSSLPLPPQQRALSGPFDARIGFGRPWSALFVAADSIAVTLAGAEGALHTSASQQTMDEFLPGDAAPDGTFRVAGQQVGLGGVAFGGKPSTATQVRFHVAAQGIQRMEWHNATLQCAGACPDGAGTLGASQDDPMGRDSVQLMFYQELQLAGGTLEGSGQAFAYSAGGGPLNLTLDGAGRFPQSRLEGPCPDGACPGEEGQTVLLEGRLELVALHRDGDRLSAGLQGAPTAVRFDEEPVSPQLILAVGVGAVAGTAAAGITLWALWLLFSRELAGRVNARRQLILQAIVAHPGANVYDLVQATAFGRSTLRHHLPALVKAGKVTEHPDRSIACYFESGRFTAQQRTLVVLRKQPALGQLYDWIQANPGNTTRQVYDHAGQAWGWAATSTEHRLMRLLEAGVVERRPDARNGKLCAVPVRLPGSPSLEQSGQPSSGPAADAPAPELPSPHRARRDNASLS